MQVKYGTNRWDLETCMAGLSSVDDWNKWQGASICCFSKWANIWLLSFIFNALQNYIREVTPTYSPCCHPSRFCKRLWNFWNLFYVFLPYHSKEKSFSKCWEYLEFKRDIHTLQMSIKEWEYMFHTIKTFFEEMKEYEG